MSVAITSPAINASITQGDPYSATISGTWSATNLGSGTVYLQVSDSAGTFSLPAIQAAPTNNTFSYALPLASGIGIGARSGTITVKACKDTNCTNAYAGTPGSVAYQVAIDETIGDWETAQGNAAHNGYVPVTLDPSKFSKAWEWVAPGSGTHERASIGPPVTGSDGVYFRVGPYTPQKQQEQIVALNENDGSLRWQNAPIILPSDQTFLQVASFPAFAAGKVYVGTSKPFYPNGVSAMDADTGGIAFIAPGIRFMDVTTIATPHNGSIFTLERVAGENRSVASVDASTGIVLWHSSITREFEGAGSVFPQVVSVDDAYVYYYGQAGLHMVDRQTSTEVALIPPAATPENGPGTPMLTLGGRNNALAYFYAFSQDSFQYEWYFASYDIAGRELEWTTSSYYNGVPAVANGVIYATRASNNRVSLNALSEATGQLLWSWTAPEQDARFVVGNVVATKTHVFLSAGGPTIGTGTTWAIDLNTHLPAWSYPAAGEKAISANRMLYISHPGASTIITNDARLIAFKLR